MDFIVEVSARHVHLTQEHVEALFGKGHELTFDRPLSQPGQFLSKEKVTIKNGDRKIERVSILGPVRKASQVEVSKTGTAAAVRVFGRAARYHAFIEFVSIIF